MILSKREQDLLKAFLQVGKLSLKEMTEILQVSTRTVYRTLSDLTPYLDRHGVKLIKEGRKYSHLKQEQDNKASRKLS